MTTPFLYVIIYVSVRYSLICFSIIISPLRGSSSIICFFYNHFTPSGFIFNHLIFYNHSIPSGLKNKAFGIEEKCRRHDMIIVNLSI